MGSIRTVENLAKPVKLTVSTLQLPASRLNIGAAQYVTSALTLNTAVTGVGGLDATVVAGSLYYLYAVVSSGTVYLIGSTNSSLPSGFTLARQVGGFTTNASSQIDQVGEYPGNLAVAGSVSAGGGLNTAYRGANLAINGGMDFWQRGTTGFTTPDIYTADRWHCSGNSFAVTRGALAVDELPYGLKYYLRNTLSGNSANYSPFQTRLEDVAWYSGRTITVSFYARSSGPTLNLRLDLYYGTGGSTTDNLYEGGLSLTSSWQLITRTYTIPSLASKTIGANNYLGLVFLTRGTATGTLDITGVMVNDGPAALPFQRAGGTIGGELSLCQRYCQLAGRGMPFTTHSNPGLGWVNWTFPVTMRSTPQVSQMYTNLYILATGPNATVDINTTNSGIDNFVEGLSGMCRIRLTGFGTTPNSNAYYSLCSDDKFLITAEL